ncbi:hypothetical protein ACWGQQ_43965 [Bradyrhizobium sp. Lot33]
MTGLLNSATTSRMISIDSASRRRRCLGSTWFFFDAGCLSLAGVLTQRIAPQGDKAIVAELGLAIAHVLSIRSNNLASREQDRMPGMPYPTPSSCQPGVDTRLALRNQTEV